MYIIKIVIHEFILVLKYNDRIFICNKIKH